MLVRENLFIPRAEITHDFVMLVLDMLVKVRPPPAGNIARGVGAIISKQQKCIIMDLPLLIFNSQGFIRSHKIGFCVVFIRLLLIVGENHIFSFRLYKVSHRHRHTPGLESNLPYNARMLSSCTMPAVSMRRYGKFDDCMERPNYAPLGKRI